MKQKQILKQCEGLSHDQRWAFLIDLGQQNNSETTKKSMQDFSLSECHYERVLSQMYAQSNRDTLIIERLLLHNSTAGMKASITLAARFLSDETILRIFLTIPKVKRLLFVSELFKENRHLLIEECLKLLPKRHQNKYLLYTRESYLNEHLTFNIIESFNDSDWYRFASLHPQLTYDKIQELLANDSESSTALSALNTVLRVFYKKTNYSSLGVSLIESHIKSVPHHVLLLNKYLSTHPEQLIKIILEHSYIQNISASATILNKLDDELFIQLLPRLKHFNNLNTFKKLTKEKRQLIYIHKSSLIKTQDNFIQTQFIEFLNEETRFHEAHKAMNSQQLQLDVLTYLKYMSYLPYQEAVDTLVPYLKDRDGYTRAAAYATYIKLGRYYPEKLDDILSFCVSKQKEQEPARNSMLEALLELPQVNRWNDQQLDMIKQIILATFDNSDSSYTTMSLCSEWTMKLLVEHTEFAASLLPKILKYSGQLGYYGRQEIVSLEAFITLDKNLKNLLRSWLKRDHAQPIFQLASRFSQNIKTSQRYLKEQNKENLNIVDALIDLTYSRTSDVAQQALNTLINIGLTDVTHTLIPELLKKDASWINVYEVSNYINKKRQDLLSPFLVPRFYKGLFASNVAAIYITFNHYFIRWTQDQQIAYSKTLEKVLKKKVLHYGNNTELLIYLRICLQSVLSYYHI